MALRNFFVTSRINRTSTATTGTAVSGATAAETITPALSTQHLQVVDNADFGDEVPCQPDSVPGTDGFPLPKFGKRERSFFKNWYTGRP